MFKKWFLLVLILAAWLPSKAVQLDSNGNKLLWLKNFGGINRDCRFMADDNYFIYARDSVTGQLEIRRTIDASLIRSVSLENGSGIYSIDLTSDGNYVAIGGDKVLRIYESNTLNLVKDLSKAIAGYYFHSINSVSFSLDGKQLAIAGTKGTPDSVYPETSKLYVIDIENNKVLFSYGSFNPYQNLTHAKYSPDGKYLACNYEGGSDKNVHVFSTEKYQEYAILNNDDGFSQNGSSGPALVFSPNSKMLVANNGQSPLSNFRIWDLTTKSLIINDVNSINNAVSTTFFNDNNLLLVSGYMTGSGAGYCYFYDVSKKKYIASFPIPVVLLYSMYLNHNESLLLGINGPCLVQIDKSILTVKDKSPNDANDLIKPNPTTGIINLSINLPYNDVAQIKIYNLRGNEMQVLYNSFTTSGLFEFNTNVNSLPTGIYLLKVNQRDFVKSFNLIKE